MATQYYIVHNLTEDRKTLSKGMDGVLSALRKIADHQGVAPHEVKAELYFTGGYVNPLENARKMSDEQMNKVREQLKK